MNSSIVRRVSFLLAAVLLLAVVAASFNAQPAQAGGSPQPFYQLISARISANSTFTIYTHTKINGANTYTVYSQPSNTDYYVAALGTDYLCIEQAKTKGHPLCIPYSAMAGLTY
jgi:hypothetical protein